MPNKSFNRDALAQWYAKQHLATDPAIQSVYYLPEDAPPREIRLIEINELIRVEDAALMPIDFGVDRGLENEHFLFVLDVTPDQWDRILKGKCDLPPTWSLSKMQQFRQRYDVPHA